MIWKGPREFYFRTGANCTSSDSNGTTRTVHNDDQYSRQVKLRWSHRSSAGFSWRNRRQQAHKPFLELRTLFQEVNSQFDDNSIIPLLFVICWWANCIPELKYVWDSGQGTEKTGDPDKNGYGVSVETATCRTSDADKRHNVGASPDGGLHVDNCLRYYIIYISLGSNEILNTNYWLNGQALAFISISGACGADLTLVALKRVLILCGTPEMQRLMHWCSAQYSAYTQAHAAYSGKSIADPST